MLGRLPGANFSDSVPNVMSARNRKGKPVRELSLRGPVYYAALRTPSSGRRDIL